MNPLIRSLTPLRQAAFGALLLFGAAQSQASLLIGNTPLGGASTGNNDIFSTQWNAAQFTLSSTSYWLDSVVLNASNGGDGVGGLSVEIYDASGTASNAGSSLATLATTDSVGNSFANITFTAAAPFMLAANTTYWMVAKGTLDGTSGTNNTRLRTNANAYLGDADILANTNLTQRFCADGTGGCFDDPITWLTSPGSPGGFNEMAYAVHGTAVPEPASMAIMGLAVTCLVGARARRRQRG